MLKHYTEKVSSCFKGTIIDFESYGDFCQTYRGIDSREYKDIIPTIFGYINCDELNVLCANGKDSVPQLASRITALMPTLERPLYAFNCHFEQGVLHHYCSKKVLFDGELNTDKYESKWRAVKALKIPNHDDPFFDDGNKCKLAWLNSDYPRAIAHNRSCLLKERDILLMRSYREPDEQRFV